MRRFSIIIPRVNKALVRGFATEAATASTTTTPTPAELDALFPVSYGMRHRTVKQDMPTPRGQTWGQTLVKNHELPTPTGTWTPESRRSGVLFTKAGMTSVFDQYGCRHALTILDIDDCQVINVESRVNRRNHQRMQLGCSNRKEKNVNKPQLGHFQRARVAPKLHLKDTRVTPDALLPIGWKFDVRHFVVGQFVDIIGTSTGKGFQGVMKKYGFGGQPASHGVSITHRSLGSTGQCQDPGRVFKNKKMPGHMGGETIQVQNVRIFQIMPRRNVILVKGQVPGPVGSMVYVRDALKRPFSPESPPPFPTYIVKHGDKKEESFIPVELMGEDPYANGNIC